MFTKVDKKIQKGVQETIKNFGKDLTYLGNYKEGTLMDLEERLDELAFTSVPKPVNAIKTRKQPLTKAEMKEKLKAQFEKKILKAKQHYLEMKTKSKKRIVDVKEKLTQPKMNDLKKSIQKLVNMYVRTRDKKDGCISCGTFTTTRWEAGHFWTLGAHSALRYDLENIHKQCHGCNYHKHGNINEYRLALVKKIGKERVQYLDDHAHDYKKWNREELEEMQKMLHEYLKSLTNMDD